MKLYDKKNKRLIVLGQRPDPEYWDRHWHIYNLNEKIKSVIGNRLVKKFTLKFLTPGSRILEGGCGIGQNVYALKAWGYATYGVDFAPKTIARLKNEFPDLNLFVQDVRELDFPDNFFDGYWSLGVIEHFWEGYREMLNEAERVIKPKGYLFLTFPYTSPLRKLKIELGLYKTFEEINADNFYQFILNEENVKADVEKHGFELILKYPYDATKGIKDEILLLKPYLQRIYNGQKFFMKGIRVLVSLLFSKVGAHSIFLLFQKK